MIALIVNAVLAVVGLVIVGVALHKAIREIEQEFDSDLVHIGRLTR